jgi:hypothetical protein
MGPGRRGAEAADMLALRDETSAVVLPIRVIFLGASSARGSVGFLKGGFCSPILEETRNFWFDGGIDSSTATRSDKSEMVASDAKDNATGLPWCVRVSSSSSEAGVEGMSVAMVEWRFGGLEMVWRLGTSVPHCK